MMKPSFYDQVLVFHLSAFSVHIDAFENPAIIGCDKILAKQRSTFNRMYIVQCSHLSFVMGATFNST